MLQPDAPPTLVGAGEVEVPEEQSCACPRGECYALRGAGTLTLQHVPGQQCTIPELELCMLLIEKGKVALCGRAHHGGGLVRIICTGPNFS